jgi:hypothetical protein
MRGKESELSRSHDEHLRNEKPRPPNVFRVQLRGPSVSEGLVSQLSIVEEVGTPR